MTKFKVQMNFRLIPDLGALETGLDFVTAASPCSAAQTRRGQRDFPDS